MGINIKHQPNALYSPALEAPAMGLGTDIDFANHLFSLLYQLFLEKETYFVALSLLFAEANTSKENM